MVKAPKHRDQIEQEEKAAQEEGPPSHETKDSQDREKAAKIPESNGNEWGR